MMIVYAKSNCPNCVQAKNILESKGVEYEYINVEDVDGAREHLEKFGFKSLPQIFNEATQEFIPNGHLGLLRLMREGKLK